MRISDLSSDVCSSDLGLVGWIEFSELVGQRSGDPRDVFRRGLNVRIAVGMHITVGAIELGRHFQHLHIVAGLEVAGRARNHLRVVALLGKRSEEHTSELQSLMRISYAVFCLKKKTT